MEQVKAKLRSLLYVRDELRAMHAASDPAALRAAGKGF